MQVKIVPIHIYEQEILDVSLLCLQHLHEGVITLFAGGA